ncbi:MAG: hypothetical protein WBA57_03770 [Elainellaceae cyanobacterium]
MNSELHEFLKAYIAAVHKRLFQALDHDEKSQTEADLAFFDGAIFCYQDTLKMLKEQMQALGHDVEPFEPIVIEAERQRPSIPNPDSSSDPEML